MQEFKRYALSILQKLHQTSKTDLVFAVSADPARVHQAALCAHAQSPQLQTRGKVSTQWEFEALCSKRERDSGCTYLVFTVYKSLHVTAQLKEAHALGGGYGKVIQSGVDDEGLVTNRLSVCCNKGATLTWRCARTVLMLAKPSSVSKRI